MRGWLVVDRVDYLLVGEELYLSKRVQLFLWSKTITAMRVVSDVRNKNQVTVPHQIAKRMGLAPGTRLVFDLDPDDPDVVHVRRLRESYAGVARGVYGQTSDDIAEYIRTERESWDR